VKIFIDMDGVLVDFVGGAADLFNRDHKELLQNWPAGEYDICKVLDIPTDEFWAEINRHGKGWWEALSPTKECFELIEMVEKIDPEWTVATSPSQDPNNPLAEAMAAAGKIAWMQKHLNKGFRRYMIGPAKYLLAGPDRVLIDDSKKKCMKFWSSGGLFALFPRPWNDLGSIDALDYMQLRLDAISIPFCVEH